jgi:AcrR family transcriptional regulator
MTREMKSPEDRKRQIMDTATKLFNDQGYEKTSVNAIINEANIAKGTFYYYFKSKDELLLAIIDNYYTDFVHEIVLISDDPLLNPFVKINSILSKLINPSSQSSPFSNYIDDDRSNKIHSNLEERFRFHFHPVLTKVLQEGVEQGVFTLNYPEDLSEILLIGIQGYIHYHLPHFEDPQYAYKKLKAIEELFNKVLVNPVGKIVLL